MSTDLVDLMVDGHVEFPSFVFLLVHVPDSAVEDIHGATSRRLGFVPPRSCGQSKPGGGKTRIMRFRSKDQKKQAATQ